MAASSSPKKLCATYLDVGGTAVSNGTPIGMRSLQSLEGEVPRNLISNSYARFGGRNPQKSYC
jgi:hypothetical protein